MILTFWLFSGALCAPEFSDRAPEKSNFEQLLTVFLAGFPELREGLGLVFQNYVANQLTFQDLHYWTLRPTRANMPFDFSELPPANLPRNMDAEEAPFDGYPGYPSYMNTLSYMKLKKHLISMGIPEAEVLICLTHVSHS